MSSPDATHTAAAATPRRPARILVVDDERSMRELLAIVLLPLGWEPHSALLAFVGGSIGGLGLVAFYRAMSLHLIGVIAPIAGFVGAALPTAVGLIIGERLGIWQLGGVGIGLGAIALINGAGRTTAKKSGSGIVLAVLAGMPPFAWRHYQYDHHCARRNPQFNAATSVCRMQKT